MVLFSPNFFFFFTLRDSGVGPPDVYPEVPVRDREIACTSDKASVPKGDEGRASNPRYPEFPASVFLQHRAPQDLRIPELSSAEMS